MDLFKFEAFLEEFPFLRKCLRNKWGGLRDPTDCGSIDIRRIDANLLSHSPRYSGATGAKVGIDDGERMDLVLVDDSVIQHAVKSQGSCVHNEAHTDNSSWVGETVLEAIARHEADDEVAYIVSVFFGYVVRDHYSDATWRAVIYKPARGVSICDLIDEAHNRARLAVLAEAAF